MCNDQTVMCTNDQYCHMCNNDQTVTCTKNKLPHVTMTKLSVTRVLMTNNETCKINKTYSVMCNNDRLV